MSVRVHFLVSGRGPLGSEVDSGMCNPRRVGPVGEARVFMTMYVEPDKRPLGRCIGFWFVGLSIRLVSGAGGMFRLG